MRVSYDEWKNFDLSMHTNKQRSREIRIVLSVTIQDMWTGRWCVQLFGFKYR